ncbi:MULTISPECIES: hypothetical protein [unclassified Sphingobium]|uniref:hypothetical protein n=1 Tax=unclassified Sphingobium TaxID=2611147 RepID=UPI0022242874|nr:MULTISPECIES: hypothetical protein [unclassified Sphingobium]MCW2411138.1 hypothetical protein [Sphingobium sp. B8D3D]MCW2416570.1 hypothetical protein [Sphingobium sp. B8D3A]
MRLVLARVGALMMMAMSSGAAQAQAGCDKACLEEIMGQYRAAYLAHDVSAAPFADHVRFTENNIEMAFPDASWDTVTEEVGTALTLSDPQTGQAAAFMAINQSEIPGYLAVRLKIENRKITEVEHMLSTKRNLSSPPTPFAEPKDFVRPADRATPVPQARRNSREELLSLGDGYFQTLENNIGEIRNTRFAPDAIRYENGMIFGDIEKDFRLGRYAFNNKVRRVPILVDEERGISLFRGFIDHKGVLADYTLTDGTPRRSIFREPHSWALLEMFKIQGGMITGVEATFITAPYNATSPWGPGNGK